MICWCGVRKRIIKNPWSRTRCGRWSERSESSGRTGGRGRLIPSHRVDQHKSPSFNPLDHIGVDTGLVLSLLLSPMPAPIGRLALHIRPLRCGLLDWDISVGGLIGSVRRVGREDASLRDVLLPGITSLHMRRILRGSDLSVLHGRIASFLLVPTGLSLEPLDPRSLLDVRSTLPSEILRHATQLPQGRPKTSSFGLSRRLSSSFDDMIELFLEKVFPDRDHDQADKDRAADEHVHEDDGLLKST